MQPQHCFEHYERPTPPVGDFCLCPFCGTPLEKVTSGGLLRPTCSFVQHRNPSPAVSILIVDNERILLGQRGGPPGEGTWSLPSGYIEYDDDFVSTAVQEAREEIGLEVEVDGILNVISSFVSPRFHFLGVYVRARVLGGTPRPGDDLVSVHWFSLAGPLPALGFAEDASIIELHRSGFRGIPVAPPQEAATNK